MVNHYVLDNWERGYLPCSCGKEFNCLDDFVMHLKTPVESVESTPIITIEKYKEHPRQLSSMIGAIKAKQHKLLRMKGMTVINIA